MKWHLYTGSMESHHFESRLGPAKAPEPPLPSPHFAKSYIQAYLMLTGVWTISPNLVLSSWCCDRCVWLKIGIAELNCVTCSSRLKSWTYLIWVQLYCLKIILSVYEPCGSWDPRVEVGWFSIRGLCMRFLNFKKISVIIWRYYYRQRLTSIITRTARATSVF